MNKYNDKLFYKVIKAIVKPIFFLLYKPKVEGLENIPKNERVLLVGNHTSHLDAPFLMSIVKREIHFLAKIELFKGPKKIIFSNLGLIPVDRKKKNKEAVIDAIEYLKNEKVVLILFTSFENKRHKSQTFARTEILTNLKKQNCAPTQIKTLKNVRKCFGYYKKDW